MLAIGITGGIGSGKTGACKIFASLGANVLYADVVAKKVMAEDKQVIAKIQTLFGISVLSSNEELDRRLMAKLVFSDKVLRDKLNAIVHPIVLSKISKEINIKRKVGKYPMVVVEAALIYESGADKMFDYVIVVNSSKESAIERIIKRDGMSKADVVQRMQAQMPVEMKLLKADFVIHNTGDLRLLEKNCKFVFSLLKTIGAEVGTTKN